MTGAVDTEGMASYTLSRRIFFLNHSETLKVDEHDN